MNVLVMCQGQQRRLPHLQAPKHLLPIGLGGESIVGRTVRLLTELAPDLWSIYLVGPPALRQVFALGEPDDQRAAQAAAPGRVLNCQIPDPGICIVDGILALLTDWHPPGRTLVLLGDVVWSRAALAAVLADPRPLVFAGTPTLSASEGELFALAFDDPQAVRNLCMSCPCRVDGSRLRGFKHQQGGHLRRLLWHLQDQRHLRLPPTRQTWHPDVYLPIEDWTDDVDTPADVVRLPELARLAELEERRQELALDPAAATVAG